MPTITDLKTQKKRPDLYSVFLNGEFWCGLSDLQVATRHLSIGDEISDEMAAELREQADTSKAYAAALRFLSYRIRSRREVMDYLVRKDLADQSDSLLERLEAEGYVNDEDFLRRWVVMRQADGRSPKEIEFELLRKGLDKDGIVRALDQYTVEQRQEALKKILQKKRASEATLQKISQNLQRKGWRYNEIKDAFDTLSSS